MQDKERDDNINLPSGEVVTPKEIDADEDYCIVSESELSSLYSEAIEHWGERTQIDQTQEELAELIVALSHAKRGRLTRSEVMEEMADVSLTLGQLFHIFKIEEDEFDKMIYKKYIRVRNKLDRAIKLKKK